MGPLGMLLREEVLQLNFSDAQKEYRKGPRGAAPVSLPKDMYSPEFFSNWVVVSLCGSICISVITNKIKFLSCVY